MSGRAARWARDLAIGSASANVAGIAALLMLIAAMDGVSPMLGHVPEIGAAAGMTIGTGVLGGAIVGGLGGTMRDGVGERWWLMLPAGFPLGAVVGAAEMLMAGVVLGGTDAGVTLLAGGACGGTVLGLGWPLYLVLDEAGKPGWAAIVAAPLVAMVALLAVVGLLEVWF